MGRHRHSRRGPRQRSAGIAAASVLIIIIAVAPSLVAGPKEGGGQGHAAPATAMADTAGQQPAPSGPPPVPTDSAYLGAFVAPHQSESDAQSDIRVELGDIGNFDGVFGRPLGIVHVYQNWNNPVKNSALAALAATGATPMIDWACTSDANIVNGSQDTLITSYAEQLASFGRPLFLRWFWEMNLTGEPRNASCLGSTGATGYVQAFQHIVTLFRNAGATNVAFVWCPSIQGTGFAAPYYPGDSYVDWIGWDGYDRKQDPNMLTDLFLPFYQNWLPHGKPMMIGETGATLDQASYLTNLTDNLPTLMPGVKAVVYYDSESTSDWTLEDQTGNLGLRAYITMGQTPYFMYPYAGS
jgi:Glycosyl hydrolase family 26